MLLQIIEMEGGKLCETDSFGHLKSTSIALADTIEHLKELVNIQTGLVHKAENLNLKTYLKQVLVVLREEIQRNKVKINNLIPDDVTVAFNPAYLESILLNFTTNAIRYASPERTPEITYTYNSSNGVRSLEIKDNGLGINIEKYGERLFGMYKTFHKNPESRGIGLFITKNQIEAMGGMVEIESEEGKGTIFKIIFDAKK
jgi:signal transduction histidine kinase